MYFLGKKNDIDGFPVRCFVGFFDITFQKVK